MKDIIFGYAFDGVQLFRELEKSPEYNVIGFADNAAVKQGMTVNGCEIRSLKDLIELKSQKDFSVFIASKKWIMISELLESNNIPVEGIYINGSIVKSFSRLDLSKEIKLYAGDIFDDIRISDPNLFGLSINR